MFHVVPLVHFTAPFFGCVQEQHIRHLQQLTRKFDERRPEIEARDNSTTVAELQHAASLVRGGWSRVDVGTVRLRARLRVHACMAAMVAACQRRAYT